MIVICDRHYDYLGVKERFDALARDSSRIGPMFKLPDFERLRYDKEFGIARISEVIQIAQLLRLPPLQLLFPGFPEDSVEYLPGQFVRSSRALQYFTGERALFGDNPLVDARESKAPPGLVFDGPGSSFEVLSRAESLLTLETSTIGSGGADTDLALRRVREALIRLDRPFVDLWSATGFETEPSSTRSQWERRIERRVGIAVRSTRLTERLSLSEVSSRTNDLGYPVTRQSIAAMERGESRHQLETCEVIVLAAALEISPLLLLFPQEPAATVEYAPANLTSCYDAVKLFAGLQCLPLDNCWQTSASGSAPRALAIDMLTLCRQAESILDAIDKLNWEYALGYIENPASDITRLRAEVAAVVEEMSDLNDPEKIEMDGPFGHGPVSARQPRGRDS